MSHEARRTGFTLVELLVVIGIVALLLAITVPALAKARAAARNVTSTAELRGLTSAYLMYAQANRGALLPGFLPDKVQGVAPSASDPISGQTFTGRAARQWPYRLAESMGPRANLFRLLRPTLAPSDFPQSTDAPTVAESKAYAASLYPVFGLNTVFLGGHGASAGATDYFKGFAADGTPNIGRHVAFRLTEVRRTDRQIVFVEVAIQNGSTSVDTDDRAGLHYASPPRADAASGAYWTAPQDRLTVTLPATPRRTLGVPYSRSRAKGVPVAFLDGHVEALRARELTDMRLWAPKATTPDYDF